MLAQYPESPIPKDHPKIKKYKERAQAEGTSEIQAEPQVGGSRGGEGSRLSQTRGPQNAGRKEKVDKIRLLIPSGCVPKTTTGLAKRAPSLDAFATAENSKTSFF